MIFHFFFLLSSFPSPLFLFYATCSKSHNLLFITWCYLLFLLTHLSSSFFPFTKWIIGKRVSAFNAFSLDKPCLRLWMTINCYSEQMNPGYFGLHVHLRQSMFPSPILPSLFHPTLLKLKSKCYHPIAFSLSYFSLCSVLLWVNCIRKHRVIGLISSDVHSFSSLLYLSQPSAKCLMPSKLFSHEVNIYFFFTHILSLCMPRAHFTLLSTQSLLTFNLQANVCNVRHLHCTLHTVTSLFNWFGFGSINFSHPFSLLLLLVVTGYSLTHWPLIIFMFYILYFVFYTLHFTFYYYSSFWMI